MEITGLQISMGIRHSDFLQALPFPFREFYYAFKITSKYWVHSSQFASATSDEECILEMDNQAQLLYVILFPEALSLYWKGKKFKWLRSLVIMVCNGLVDVLWLYNMHVSPYTGAT